MSNQFAIFRILSSKLNQTEKQLAQVQNQLWQLQQSQFAKSYHLKNDPFICQSFLSGDIHYIDIQASDAKKKMSDPNFCFNMLDVSNNNLNEHFAETIQSIPLIELPTRYQEITNTEIPIFVISKDGCQSILACEILHQAGFKLIYHISGGYNFWQG